MALKIIGAGYGRTGTLSTQKALNILGFHCYHMEEVLYNKKNKSHLDFWLKVARSDVQQTHNWNEVFQNYNATVDNPGCSVWRELYKYYPEAKVLLTIHPKGAGAWYDSTMNTIYFSEFAWEYKLLSFFIPRFRKLGQMTHLLVWQKSLKGVMKDREAAIAEYKQHIEEVKSVVHADKLLIFSVDQGWKPLCQFLNVTIPNRDFPNKNDTKEFRKMIFTFKLMAYCIIGLGLLLLLLSFYYLI